jgi:hypothetical protein
MAITTYSELQSAVADFLNRDDLTSAIPTFISLAEADIARQLRHTNQEKRLTADLDERYEILPDDFLEMRRMSLSDGTQLEPMSGTEMGDRRYKNQDVANQPQYYYITAGEIEFYPTPDDTYEMTMLYYARIPALSDTSTSNWLLTDYPDIYLYGALMHSAPYLADDARLQVWASMYTKAIGDANLTSKRSTYAGGALVLRNR